MLVKDVMTSPAVTVSATMSVKEGLRLLDRHHVTALPVTDDAGRILGIVSEVDLLRDSLRPDGRARMTPRYSGSEHPSTVEEVMSTLSMTVPSHGDLSEAVELMTTTAVKSLPVIEDGRVVGVVSRSDIVRMLARDDERIEAEVDELLRSAGLVCDVLVDDGVVTVTAGRGQERVVEVIAGSVPGVISVNVHS